MTLPATIDGWPIEHDRAVRTTVRMTAIEYRHLYGERFPPDVMVIGDNWVYIAGLNYLESHDDVPMGNGLSLDLSQSFTINPREACGLTRYVPLEKIMKDFDSKMPNEELVMFPLSRRRMEEAKGLGEEVRVMDDYVDIQSPRRKIKVIEMPSDGRTNYSARTEDGLYCWFYTNR